MSVEDLDQAVAEAEQKLCDCADCLVKIKRVLSNMRLQAKRNSEETLYDRQFAEAMANR